MKKHLVNLGALSSIQMANALLPVLVFPWLLSVVGPALFARIALTEAVTFFVLAVVLYSFEVDGVAKVAGLRLHSDRAAIARIFSAILYARLLLLGICLAALGAAALVLEPSTSLLLLGWLLLPLGHTLQSTWLFQGLERNLALALCVVGSRLLCLGALYLLVTGPGSFTLVPVIIGGLYALGGLAALLYLALVLEIRPERVSWQEVRALLVGGKEIFFGNLSVTLFRESNVLILGVFGGAAAVSVYAIAEKLVKCFQAMSRPLNQLMFPRVIRALAEHKQPDREAFRIVLRYTWPQLLTLSVVALLLGVSYVLFRAHFPDSYRHPLETEIVMLIGIMVLAVLFGVSNFMFGTAGLNYLQQRGYFARAIFVTGVCSVLMCSVLGYVWAERGAALTFLFSEALLFSLIARAYLRRPA